MSQIFYRYLRPTRFLARRAEIETLALGGICLRFEPRNDKLAFSFSRCRNDELFSKTVAKQIADRRAIYFAEADCELLVDFSHNTDVLVQQVISACRDIKFPTISKPIHYYLLTELNEFSNALENLTIEHNEVQRISKIWVEGINSANLKKTYENS